MLEMLADIMHNLRCYVKSNSIIQQLRNEFDATSFTVMKQMNDWQIVNKSKLEGRYGESTSGAFTESDNGAYVGFKRYRGVIWVAHFKECIIRYDTKNKTSQVVFVPMSVYDLVGETIIEKKDGNIVLRLHTGIGPSCTVICDEQKQSWILVRNEDELSPQESSMLK